MNLVKLDWHDAVAIISLNRPDAANAISIEFAEALRGVAQEIAGEGRARAVLLRAEGKMFSGGGDVGAGLAAFAHRLLDGGVGLVEREVLRQEDLLRRFASSTGIPAD